jgi:hypothetical protein
MGTTVTRGQRDLDAVQHSDVGDADGTRAGDAKKTSRTSASHQDNSVGSFGASELIHGIGTIASLFGDEGKSIGAKAHELANDKGLMGLLDGIGKFLGGLFGGGNKAPDTSAKPPALTSNNPAQQHIEKEKNQDTDSFEHTSSSSGHTILEDDPLTLVAKGKDLLDGKDVELARGEFKEEVRRDVGTSTSFDNGVVSGQASANASAHAGVSGQGSVSVGKDGLKAQGSIEARAGVSASANASARTAAGTFSAGAEASIEAFARVQGEASVGLDGIKARGQAEVGAYARANVHASWESPAILGLKASANARAYSEVGTGANAIGEASLSFAPPTAVVTGKASAFAGAKAGASADFGVGPLKGTVGVEARTGIGIEVGGSVGIKDGKLGVEFNLGAALGIGVGINIKIEIDLKPIGDFLSSVFGIFGGGKGDNTVAQAAVDGASKFFGGFQDGKKTLSSTQSETSTLTTSQETFKSEEAEEERARAQEDERRSKAS